MEYHCEMAKQIEAEFEENNKIRGHLSYLDKTRLVFIGQAKEAAGTWFVGFRNTEGKNTKLALSGEAMAMLVQLYRKRHKGDDVFPLKIETKWQVTVKPSEDTTP